MFQGDSLLHTLQDASLVGCSLMCCGAVAFFFVLSSLTRVLGRSVSEVLGGFGGLLGILELFNLGDIAQRFLGGSLGDQDRRR